MKSELTIALELLTRLLAEHHGERVVILLDEYDSPIHAGYTKGYYDDVIAFFRDFLSGGLKENPHLFKGVLTGILRVAKESLFSGLNNVTVYGILRQELAPYFGFTEPEVRDLVAEVGQPELLDDIRSFYNGYLFGDEAIYNPWSVLSFLSSTKKELLPCWIETSSNDLVRELLLTGPRGVRAELETLLARGAIDKRIEEDIVLRDLSLDPGAVWSFLLFTGYLKPVELRLVDGRRRAKLAVPNTEVAIALQRMTEAWIETQLGGSEALEAMLSALLRGDGPMLERHLSHLAKVNLSYFDTVSTGSSWARLLARPRASSCVRLPLGPRSRRSDSRSTAMGDCAIGSNGPGETARTPPWLEPLDLVVRLVALIPPPRFHMLCRGRAEVVPRARRARGCSSGLGFDAANASAPTGEPASTSERASRHPWAWLLARVFAVDVTVCPQCAGRMHLVKLATTREEITKVLAHAGLGPRPPASAADDARSARAVLGRPMSHAKVPAKPLRDPPAIEDRADPSLASLEMRAGRTAS